MDGPLTMPLTTLNSLMDDLRIGPLPPLLRPDAVWMDEDEAARRATQRVDDELADSLYTLAHPATEYGAVVRTGDQQRSVFAAERGRDVVLAERVGHVVSVTMLRDRSAMGEFLRRVPDAPPARIHAVNLRRSDLVRSVATWAGFDSTRGLPERDVATVAMLLRHPLVGQGELYVATHDPFGRVALGEPVRYQDYGLGRVLIVLSDEYFSVAAASRSALTRRLSEELHRIRWC